MAANLIPQIQQSIEVFPRVFDAALGFLAAFLVT